MSATAAVGAQATPTTRTAGRRLGALAGLAFTFLFFMGTATLNIPHGASDAKLLAWWADSGNQTTAIVSMYLFIVAGLCFLLFLTKLRSRLLAAEGGTGELTSLVVASGAVFVAMLLVAAASRGVIGFAVKSPGDSESLPGADTLRYLPQTGYAALGIGGLLAATVAMATTSWLIVRTAVFGRWLAWLGAATALVIVVAAAALVGMLAIPAMLIWVLAVSVAMWRAPR
ncbi:MAG: hypothetical protein ABWY51_08925 [Gaiellaceae bacterium]